jgi:hypothetical protein
MFTLALTLSPSLSLSLSNPLYLNNIPYTAKQKLITRIPLLQSVIQASVAAGSGVFCTFLRWSSLQSEKSRWQR